jgi:hypothetical protein
MPPSPDDAYCKLAGLRFRERNQLPDVARGEAGMRAQHQRPLRDQRDRREVFHRVERQFVQARIHRERRRRDQQRIAVGRRFRNHVDADDAVGSRAVIGDDLLLPDVGQLMREDARDDVVAARRGKRNQKAHGPVRKSFVGACRLCERCDGGHAQRNGNQPPRPESRGEWHARRFYRAAASASSALMAVTPSRATSAGGCAHSAGFGAS